MRSFKTVQSVADGLVTTVRQGFCPYKGQPVDFLAVVQAEDSFELYELDWQYDDRTQDGKTIAPALEALEVYLKETGLPYGEVVVYSR